MPDAPTPRIVSTVYVGLSVDGFIARPDNTVDFLDVDPPPTDDMGFGAFIESVDVLVMGRTTYDFVVGAVEEWPYGDLKVVVLTTRPLAIDGASADRVSTWEGKPAVLLAELADAGHRHAYVDGGSVAQQFLAAGLVDRLILTSVPILIGQGVPLFGEVPADVPLSLESSTPYPNGMIQTTYTVRG